MQEKKPFIIGLLIKEAMGLYGSKYVIRVCMPSRVLGSFLMKCLETDMPSQG